MLHGPRTVRVRGHAQEMHVTGAYLDHEEDVQAAQGDRAAQMEEIAREHRRCLRAQELPPGRLAALRRRWYPQPFQDPPDSGGPHADAEAEQFALDPRVSPAGGSRAPSARSAPRSADPRAVGHPSADKSIASGPAAGASEAACLASPAGSSAAPRGAVGPGRRTLPGRPSAVSLWDSAAAAQLLPGAGSAARRPWLPPIVRAGPSNWPGGHQVEHPYGHKPAMLPAIRALWQANT